MASDLTQFGMHVLAPDRVSGWQKLPGRCFRLWGSTWGGAATHWAGVEPARGTFNWVALDAVMARFAGKRIFHTLGYVPTWANGGTDQVASRGTVPTNFQDAADFVTAVATRYTGRIAYYSPINEPGPTWWTIDATNKALSATSKAWCAQHYAAVKAADPKAIVTSPEFQAVNPLLQADDFYASGGGATCDVHAIHSYPLASVYRYRPEQMLEVDRINRRILAYYGRPSTMLWSEGSASNQVTDAGQLLAFAAIYPLIAASDGIDMFNWYAFDGGPWGPLGDKGAGLGNPGMAHRTALAWLTAATWTAPLARVAGANQIRNSTMAGAASGTLPTNWSFYNPDSGNGMSTQVVGTGAESGTPYVDVRIYGTAASGATGYVQINFENATQIACAVGQLWTDTVNLGITSATRGGLVAAAVGHSHFKSDGSYSSFGYSTEAPVFPGPAAGNPVGISQAVTDANAAFIQPYVRLTYLPGSTVDVTVRISAPATDTGSLYTGTITKPGGYRGMVLWDANGGPTPYTVPSGYGYARNWRGTQTAAAPGSSVMLTQQPVLLEDRPFRAWVH